MLLVFFTFKLLLSMSFSELLWRFKQTHPRHKQPEIAGLQSGSRKCFTGIFFFLPEGIKAAKWEYMDLLSARLGRGRRSIIECRIKACKHSVATIKPEFTAEPSKSSVNGFEPSMSVAKKRETFAAAGVPQESLEFCLGDYFRSPECGIGALEEYATTDSLQGA